MWYIIYKNLDTEEEFEGDNYYYTEDAAIQVLIEMKKHALNVFGDRSMTGYPIRVERK
jgi:hypothetical protein